MHQTYGQFLTYIKEIWQYRWYGAIFSWFLCIAGWTFVYFIPNRYEAGARVYVDTQSILRPLLRGLAVQPNIDQQVAMITRTLISRPNVEKVVRIADLDIQTRTKEDKEILIDRLMKQVAIKSTGQDNLYTISYADPSPGTAKKVVQAFLTLFVENSLGDNRKDADQARRFLDEQIKAYEQKLVLAEQRLKEFKQKNYGFVPGSSGGGGDYYGRIQEATADLEQARLALREAENSRNAVRKQLTGTETDDAQTSEAAAEASPELETRIRNLKEKLDQLRLNYTELHPDIGATKRVLAQLEKQKVDEIAAAKKSPGNRAAGNPMLQTIQMALAESDANVASLKVRVTEYEKRLAELKAKADHALQVEAEFAQLNRDYGVNKASFEQFLSRREEAHISGEMDANTGVLDFRIIDPPRVPPTPSSPNRQLLMSGVLGAGLIGGVALAFLLSRIRPTFTDRRALREGTGLPVLGAVTMIWTDAEKTKRKRNLQALAASYLGLAMAYAAILATLTWMARVA